MSCASAFSVRQKERSGREKKLRLKLLAMNQWDNRDNKASMQCQPSFFLYHRDKNFSAPFE